jgi:hypothetical protein
MMHRFIASLLVAVFVLGGAIAHATDFQSTNFISRDPVMDDFGGFSSVSGGGSFQQFNAGGQAAIGESMSTNFIMRSGFLYFNEFTVRTQNWRWYDDETNTTPTTALAAENTAPSGVVNENAVKLRITIRELAGIASGSIKYRLQYSQSADFSSGVAFVSEIGSCTASSSWCYYNGAGVDNAVVDAKVLSDADSCSGGVGNGCGTHNESGTSTSTFTHPYSAATEYEFTLKPAGPQPNTVYYFRVYQQSSGDAVEPFTGETYPSILTQGASFTFTVTGRPSGTVTEGITTDITTLPTSVSYATLTAGTPSEGAQHLGVDTNAPNGYAVYLRRTNGAFDNSQSTVIGDVSGTNAVPAAFAIPGAQTSAFGYHSGDALLSGGSTRFSADDTYALLDGTASEIIYNGGPASESADLIYKIQVTALQEAGVYGTTFQYIATPTF